MKARQVERKPAAKPRSAWRWILFGLCGLLIVLGGGAVTFGVWFVQSLRQLQAFVHQAQAEYHATNVQFPFSPPDPGRTVEQARIESYLHARAAIMQTITPEVAARAERYLNVDSMERIRLIGVMRDAYNFLHPAIEAHLAALRSEKMSLDEYLWLHGWMVREVLEKSPADSRSAAMRETLDKLGRMTESSGRGPVKSLNPRQFAAELDKEYEGHEAPPTEVIQEFKRSSSLDGMIDLLVASPAFSSELDKAAKPER